MGIFISSFSTNWNNHFVLILDTVQRYIFVSDNDEEDNKEQKPINSVEVEKSAATNNKNNVPQPAKKDSPQKQVSKSNKGKGAKIVHNQPSIMSFFKKA